MVSLSNHTPSIPQPRRSILLIPSVPSHFSLLCPLYFLLPHSSPTPNMRSFPIPQNHPSLMPGQLFTQYFLTDAIRPSPERHT